MSNSFKTNSLLEYWFVAQAARQHFFAEMPDLESNPSLDDCRQIARSSVIYLRLWYGMLYVVIEGYESLSSEETIGRSKAVDDLLAESDFVDRLRRVRNSTFHFQSSWGHRKFMAFFERSRTAGWIRDVHRELGRVAVRAELAHADGDDAINRLNAVLSMIDTQA